ncbi:hypothetical protein V5O48_017698 [Marasmius crinis-equi]|uniref:Uncharacterized protein n=1 Tax=Marasmius crinis-equi TaxID=585013 RepID=A0ABR3ENE8_9AGAR
MSLLSSNRTLDRHHHNDPGIDPTLLSPDSPQGAENSSSLASISLSDDSTKPSPAIPYTSEYSYPEELYISPNWWDIPSTGQEAPYTARSVHSTDAVLNYPMSPVFSFSDSLGSESSLVDFIGLYVRVGSN